jgi:hypothetical protein
MSNEAYPSRAGGPEATRGTAVGFILFAAIMMIMSGVFQALAGLVAIFENEFYVATRNYLFQFDATTWGWIHLVVGLIVAFAGWGLLSGRTWARVVGITLAVVSAIANFCSSPTTRSGRCSSSPWTSSSSGRSPPTGATCGTEPPERDPERLPEGA